MSASSRTGASVSRAAEALVAVAVGLRVAPGFAVAVAVVDGPGAGSVGAREQAGRTSSSRMAEARIGGAANLHAIGRFRFPLATTTPIALPTPIALRACYAAVRSRAPSRMARQPSRESHLLSS